MVRSLPGPVDRDLSGLVGELSTRSEAGRVGGPRITSAPQHGIKRFHPSRR